MLLSLVRGGRGYWAQRLNGLTVRYDEFDVTRRGLFKKLLGLGAAAVAAPVAAKAVAGFDLASGPSWSAATTWSKKLSLPADLTLESLEAAFAEARDEKAFLFIGKSSFHFPKILPLESVSAAMRECKEADPHMWPSHLDHEYMEMLERRISWRKGEVIIEPLPSTPRTRSPAA